MITFALHDVRSCWSDLWFQRHRKGVTCFGEHSWLALVHAAQRQRWNQPWRYRITAYRNSRVGSCAEPCKSRLIVVGGSGTVRRAQRGAGQSLAQIDAAAEVPQHHEAGQPRLSEVARYAQGAGQTHHPSKPTTGDWFVDLSNEEAQRVYHSGRCCLGSGEIIVQRAR
jgi:hypothetical protein